MCGRARGVFAQGSDGLVDGAEEVLRADELEEARTLKDVEDTPFCFGEGEGDA